MAKNEPLHNASTTRFPPFLPRVRSTTHLGGRCRPLLEKFGHSPSHKKHGGATHASFWGRNVRSVVERHITRRTMAQNRCPLRFDGDSRPWRRPDASIYPLHRCSWSMDGWWWRWNGIDRSLCGRLRAQKVDQLHDVAVLAPSIGVTLLSVKPTSTGGRPSQRRCSGIDGSVDTQSAVERAGS